MTRHEGSRHRQWLSRVVRVSVSVVLIGLVLSSVNVHDLRSLLDEGDVRWLPSAVLLLTIAIGISARRWQTLLSVAGLRRSFRATLRVTYIGALATNVLPGAVGGDAARTWLVGPGNRQAGLATVAVDRISLFGCGVIVGIASLPWAEAPPTLIAGLALSGAAVAALLLGLVCSSLLPQTRRLDLRFRTSVRALSSSPRAIFVALVLGVAYQVLIVAEMTTLAFAVGLNITYFQLAVVIPPVLLLTALPISVGALGVREVGFVAGLGVYGVSATEAAALGLLAGAVYLVSSLPGAIGVISKKTAADARRTPARVAASTQRLV